MVKGIEFHHIIQNIFHDVRGYLQSEQIQVNCPRCQERDGLPEPDGKFNLEINTAKRIFRCWKCENPPFSGRLGKLIKYYGSKSDYELYKSFGGDLYIYDDEKEGEYFDLSIELPKEMIFFKDLNIHNPEHLEAYNYLVFERKLTNETILKFNLGFCLTGKYAKRIIVPSYDCSGNVNYFVARSYDDSKNKKYKYLNPDINKKHIIFNEGSVNWDSTVCLVEGVFDMLSFPVNSIPLLGKTISEKLFLKLKATKPNIIILLDPDAYVHAINLFFMLKNIYVDEEDKVRIVKLPHKKYDIDKIRIIYGEDKLHECLFSARKLNVDDVFMKKIENNYYMKKQRY